MSKKISELAVEALEAGRNFKRANTRVDGHAQELYLFENLIAKIECESLYITLAGWVTLTTCERLNALNGVYIKRKQGRAYLNGQEIDPNKWYKID